MTAQLDWTRDGSDWPNREASRFVHAVGLRWHVQVMGTGPVVLLIHGTGASTHSWRDVARKLSPHYTVVAPDLPGHGFTATPTRTSGFSLPSVAHGITALLRELGLSPRLVVGHSAGAAIAIRMSLDATLKPTHPAPDAIVSLNGALLPFPGLTNDIFGPAARLLAGSRLAARAMTMFVGSRPSVDRLLRATGSRIDPTGAQLYARLLGNPSHVEGALTLMANWDLRALVHDLPNLTARLVLVSGTNDGMVPPHEVYRVRALLPAAEIIPLRDVGHLAHEERPDDVVALLERILPHETPG